MKRLFVAVAIKSSQAYQIEDSCQQLLNYKTFQDPSIRWTLKKDLHITLKFIASCTDEKIKDLDHTLREVSRRHVPFEIKGHSLGFFPSPDRARLFYLAIEKCVPLQLLQADTEKSLQKNGFPTEALKFVPHITLGRFKNAFDASELSIPFNFSLLQRVNEISLFESKPTTNRSEYIPLVQYILNGSS